MAGLSPGFGAFTWGGFSGVCSFSTALLVSGSDSGAAGALTSDICPIFSILVFLSLNLDH